MRQTPDKITKKPMVAPFDMSVLALGGQVGCSTLVIVLISVFGGLWLDRVLDTKPIFTIIFVLGSAPLALVLTYWMAMRSIHNKMPTMSDKKEKQSDEEELIGE